MKISHKDIIKSLRHSSNKDEAYFGFVEVAEDVQEFCIQSNNDGLKLFASSLLEACDLEVNYVHKVMTRPEPGTEDKPPWWEKLLVKGLLILVAYLIIAGVIFSFQLIF